MKDILLAIFYLIGAISWALLTINTYMNNRYGLCFLCFVALLLMIIFTTSRMYVIYYKWKQLKDKTNGK